MFKAVIFDMDGVLVDSMPLHYEAWRRAFEKENIFVTKIEIYEREGEQGKNTAREILMVNGISPAEDRIKKILAYKEKIFRNIQNSKFFPGAREFVKSLHKAGIVLGLVTGTSRSEVESLLPEDFLKLFSCIVTGSDVLKGKPGPEPYNRAKDLLKTKTEEILVIENAPNGIRSAKGAGLKCIALTTSLPESYLKAADWIIDSIEYANAIVFNSLNKK